MHPNSGITIFLAGSSSIKLDGVILLAYKTIDGGGRFGGGGNRYRGGGGGGRTLSLNFPPFSGAVKMLVLINVGVYFLQLLSRAFVPIADAYLVTYAQLTP